MLSSCRSLMCLLLTALSMGCGSGQVPTFPTRGRVVFADGSPVRTGNIELESEQHELTASGRIQQDGSFVLGTYTPEDGAVAGLHKVIIIQLIVNDGTVNHTMDHGKAVPPKYASYETSRLTATVSDSGPNDLIVTIEAGKRK